MYFSFKMPCKVCKNRDLQITVFHCLTLLQEVRSLLCHTCRTFTVTGEQHVHSHRFSLVTFYFILLHSIAVHLCCVSEHWRSFRPGVIIQWLTGRQALLSWPILLQVTTNSRRVMDGSWQKADSDWREKPLWLECDTTAGETFWRSPQEFAFGQAGISLVSEVLSDKGADGCGHCLEVINKRDVW